MTVASAQTQFSWWKLARTVVGLCLAPVIGGTVALLLFALPELFSGNSDLDEMLGLTWFGAAFGGILGLGPSLIIGWPLHLLLLRLRWTSIWVYVGLGAVLGMIAFPLSGMIMEALKW